ncbi:MAG: hypothetical protein O6913_04000, partial [Chloroflexi bacterium]|nr:hypothetical protein [Chloroflexota bacterium]
CCEFRAVPDPRRYDGLLRRRIGRPHGTDRGYLHWHASHWRSPPPVTGGDPNGLPNGGNGGLAQAGSTGNVLLILGASMAALIAVIGRREWSLRT